MNNLEAWSTGRVRMGIEGGAVAPVFAAVEILRIALLVHVMARADSDDPSLAGTFPIVMTAIEAYPLMSLAPDPLAEMGKRIAELFFSKVAQSVQEAREHPPELAGDNGAKPS